MATIEFDVGAADRPEAAGSPRRDRGERMTEYTPLGSTLLEQGLLDSMGSQY
ncbi:hypothetical protein [Frigoribacterium faeni]|uniref:Uncharacterized protein n=1 Tax=Frigoribacterium faeni TaxID=145483 RepID=A0A7W3JIP7_9MICO|nr:hypothetical protein [Frigoribacterium faeni]MBA8813573.1 hypothetical protein [Frigoribacterium faeni]GEK84188.1 hypothetical protein FFA01_24970 [Frigoribacterium faeni]